MSWSKEWEITIIELKNNVTKYKITRRLPKLSVAETKFFDTKEKAEKQVQKWLE